MSSHFFKQPRTVRVEHVDAKYLTQLSLEDQDGPCKSH